MRKRFSIRSLLFIQRFYTSGHSPRICLTNSYCYEIIAYGEVKIIFYDGVVKKILFQEKSIENENFSANRLCYTQL